MLQEIRVLLGFSNRFLLLDPTMTLFNWNDKKATQCHRETLAVFQRRGDLPMMLETASPPNKRLAVIVTCFL
jgi:hypothetical protein